jgi:tRNA pseudouridine38-40 synthase
MACPGLCRPLALPVAVRFAYDGSAFDSYARQPRRRTVENELIAGLRHEGFVEGSFKTGSRTDAGVSALENVCKASLDRPHIRGLVPALQKRVPDGIWVTGAAVVDEAWRPRHARRRTYSYTAIARGEDLAVLQQACAAFVGRHDMRAFAKMEQGRDPERNVFDFSVEHGDGTWTFHVTGDGFLWNQVRRMVGAACAVARGEAEVQDIERSFASGKPHRMFRLATPHGLVLEKVEYDGLRWDAEAGRLGPQLVPRFTQSAIVRLALARHLAELAPWPAGRSAASDHDG